MIKKVVIIKYQLKFIRPIFSKRNSQVCYENCLKFNSDYLSKSAKKINLKCILENSNKY